MPEPVAKPGSFEWLAETQLRATACVGICKNAGKTTLLNHLLASHPAFAWGVFSTGIDGEDSDTVFHIPKPKVCLPPGTIFCCDTATLDRHGSDVCVLEKLPAGNALRQLWLARALTPLQTEITGPASVRDQLCALGQMHSLGAEKVLVDGSLDRKSIALSDAIDAVAVVVGASFGPVPGLIAEIKRLLLLNGIPAAEMAPDSPDYSLLRDAREILSHENGQWKRSGLDSLIGHETELSALMEAKPDTLYIPGAVTDSLAPRLRSLLPEAGTRLIVRHPDCLKLGPAKLEQLLREVPVQALIPFKIKAFVLNTLSVSGPVTGAEELRSKIRREFPGLDLPDIREL